MAYKRPAPPSRIRSHILRIFLKEVECVVAAQKEGTLLDPRQVASLVAIFKAVSELQDLPPARGSGDEGTDDAEGLLEALEVPTDKSLEDD